MLNPIQLNIVNRNAIKTVCCRSFYSKIFTFEDQMISYACIQKCSNTINKFNRNNQILDLVLIENIVG